jgi:peptidoglycan hydrolase-like protein with peptidoglycan-binding domain
MTQPVAGTSTGIDGDFGPATENAVKNYQQAMGLDRTGLVDNDLFQLMCKPLNDAFNAQPGNGDLRTRIVEVAKAHLAAHPYELIINKNSNSGPWVRSYMDGHEGTDWLWCMGFVQTIVDQAASSQGKKFTDLMKLTYSCDNVAQTGIQQQLFIKNKDLRNNPSLAKPGDIFLLQKSPSDWTHTGLIINISGSVIETIEGNTNNDGSSNGNGVYRRNRNFKDKLIDVFSIAPLV